MLCQGLRSTPKEAIIISCKTYFQIACKINMGVRCKLQCVHLPLRLSELNTLLAARCIWCTTHGVQLNSNMTTASSAVLCSAKLPPTPLNMEWGYDEDSPNVPDLVSLCFIASLMWAHATGFIKYALGSPKTAFRGIIHLQSTCALFGLGSQKTILDLEKCIFENHTAQTCHDDFHSRCGYRAKVQ